MFDNKVSIIIPTYNREHLISETLDSITAQTYTNWECIVVDDGSTDDTEGVILNYIKIDSRFQYHQRPIDRIKGANACRNYGHELSRGEYIKWFDSDDIMHPDFLEKQIVVLEENDELDFCASFSKKFTNSLDDITESFYPEITSDTNSIYNFITGKLYFLTPSALWRREALEGKELFDETLYNAHETDFNFRRLIEGCKFRYLVGFLFYVRRGHQSIESESVSSSLCLQSQFEYFRKVYKFLNNSNCFLETAEIKKLKKYVIYRQVLFFYQIRILLSFKQSINNFKLILKDLTNAELCLFDVFRLVFGIVMILFFKKGYSLIHIKKFDVRS
jgi:glycosyltransferase involved in cell wall biosynthesis